MSTLPPVSLAAFLAAGVFSLFGAQPLVISGVTGPITVLNKTIFTIIGSIEGGPDYLQFIGSVPGCVPFCRT
jgi:MFS superfamily sulfate permease-like transporter